MASSSLVKSHVGSHRSVVVRRFKERFGYLRIGAPDMEPEMLQILGLSVALLLFGSGVWANCGGGSLSQDKGAWISHSR
jgi:hypothetical protein